eukprot:1026139-Amphidinium_carterae.3
MSIPISEAGRIKKGVNGHYKSICKLCNCTVARAICTDAQVGGKVDQDAVSKVLDAATERHMVFIADVCCGHTYHMYIPSVTKGDNPCESSSTVAFQACEEVACSAGLTSPFCWVKSAASVQQQHSLALALALVKSN